MMRHLKLIPFLGRALSFIPSHPGVYAAQTPERAAPISPPLHEYEMTHGGGGNRTAHLLQGSSRKQFDAQRTMPLLWGEDLLLTANVVAGPERPSRN